MCDYQVILARLFVITSSIFNKVENTNGNPEIRKQYVFSANSRMELFLVFKADFDFKLLALHKLLIICRLASEKIVVDVLKFKM